MSNWSSANLTITWVAYLIQTPSLIFFGALFFLPWGVLLLRTCNDGEVRDGAAAQNWWFSIAAKWNEHALFCERNGHKLPPSHALQSDVVKTCIVRNMQRQQCKGLSLAKCSQASFAHLWPTARPVAGPGPWTSKALEMQRLSSSKQLRQDVYKKKTDQTSMMRKNRITSCEVFKALAVTGRPTSEAKWKYSNVLQQTAWPF